MVPHIMDLIDVFEAVTGTNELGRCKTTIGMFVEEWPSEDNSNVLDEFFVEKPIINIMEEIDDEDGEDSFYTIEFEYKSARDADLKQQWLFLDKYVKRFMAVPDGAEKVPILVVSLVPIELEGRYSVLARAAFPNSIIKFEEAGTGKCTIRMMFAMNNVFGMEHDDEALDRRRIEAEAEAELQEEMRAEYGHYYQGEQ